MANQYPLSYVSSNLSKMLSEIFTEYSEELQKKAEAITEQVAEQFANDLKPVTPRSNSNVEQHLADSIVISKKSQQFYGAKRQILYVHFKKWQISHLLEFGWTARNGNRISRTPFVRPLFDQNKDKYFRMYKEGLS